MPAKSNTYANQLLQLVFNGVTIPGIAENASTAPNTNLYVSLHTADPTFAGNQATYEATYTGYARVAVARSAAGWVVSGSTVNPAASITFAPDSAGTGTITNFAIGTAATGAGEVLYTGPVSPNVTLGAGVDPILITSSNVTES